MTGRRTNAKGDEFTLGDSEYADDTGLLFCSRHDVTHRTPLIMAHFSRWGMEIHSGICDPLIHSGFLDHTALPTVKGSKSEVLFCAKPAHMYSDPSTYDGADLSPILLPNNGYMEVVSTFPYLGDIVDRDCGDAAAVDARIESGSRAFGALRGCLFASSSISNAAKKTVYEAVVLSITLYGCETWSLTEWLKQRLRSMHTQHLRGMCRITRKHVWQHHISSQELGQRLGLMSIDMYIARRQLRWLGHVSRMSYERLPRRMLSSWVRNSRPPGAPTMTYGRSVARALKLFQVDPLRWHLLAANRAAWRQMLSDGIAPPAFRPHAPEAPRSLVAQAAARAVAKAQAATYTAARPPARSSAVASGYCARGHTAGRPTLGPLTAAAANRPPAAMN